MKSLIAHLKKRKKLSLKKLLLAIIIFCWIIPVVIISGYSILSYRNGVIAKTNTLLEDELRSFAMVTSYRIDEDIELLNAYSYDLNDAWVAYHRNEINLSGFNRSLMLDMRLRFFDDKKISMAVFYPEGESGGYIRYLELKDYQSYEKNRVYHKFVQQVKETEYARPVVKIEGGRIYIIKNMYTSGIKKIGTVVVQINNNKLFEGVNKEKIYDMLLYINGTDSAVLCTADEKIDGNGQKCLEKIKKKYESTREDSMERVQEKNYQGFIYQNKYNHYHMGTVILVNNDVVYAELKDLRNIMLVVMLIMIPFLFFAIHFLKRHITQPITKLTEACKEIEDGQIGIQIEGQNMPNEEFSYLNASFNKMSAEVKELFNLAYKEKLARRDAKIIALQSQINPHFLNNTLEMMNWQARMEGDTKVSKMIEALSTLLDYSMDRSNKRMIRLSEEIRCADAYFYIISMRFGSRLIVEKEIDTSLLQKMVPQLILQPLLENAVLHGVEEAKSGNIILKVFLKDTNIVLQVINTGKKMTVEDIDRVHKILSGEFDVDQMREGKHTSLGIRNVNERIKLIYGEAYGLDIYSLEDGRTAASIIIPSEPDKTDDKEKLLKNIFNIS